MRIKLKPLSEQTIVITGGSSGIGLAIARKAAQYGARVVLVARSGEALEAVCHTISREGGTADYVIGDVGIRDDMRNVVETVVARYGGFDTWVNDAGIGVYARFEELSDDDHHKLFQTNYWGVVYGSLEALKHLRQSGGALINIGSISGDVPAPILSAYTATKHAVRGFTNSLRLEVMHDKLPVSVTLIKPSGMHTPFGRHARNYMDKESQVPPPVYHPDLVADAVMHAATHPTRSITVGGAGGAMIWLTRLCPNLADQIYSRLYFHTALGKRDRQSDESALYYAGGEGEMLGNQNSHIRRHSLYTYKQTHPWLKPVCLVGGAALAFALYNYKKKKSSIGRLTHHLPTSTKALSHSVHKSLPKSLPRSLRKSLHLK